MLIHNFKRISITIAGLILACQIFAQSNLPNDTLHWNENRKLSWNDFKGEPLDYTGFQGEAFCMNMANYERPNAFSKTTFAVTAVFDRTKSWVNPKAKTDQGLLYFQVMFDLYELHARELKKELSEINLGNDPNSIFQEEYNHSMTALSNEFNEFRKDTKLGQDSNVLTDWNRKTQEKLKLLDNYK
ncbi:MAG: hypothetical protein H6Q24_805 [Bacteroidetes bacterium]|jgi:hypothetical protein|nr:hypothetical protein [Bacteroidota bacterium]